MSHPAFASASSHAPSQAQIAANRANAQLSTGPKTDEGKARSSRNRTAHGFNSAEFFLLAEEDHASYDELFDAFCEAHSPQDDFEVVLVRKLAQHHWLIERALNLQTRALTTTAQFAEQKAQLELYLRYQATQERAFSRTLKDLQTAQKLRHEQQLGKLESEAALRTQKQALAAAKADRAHTDAESAALKLKAQKDRLARNPNRPTTLAEAAAAFYGTNGFEPQSTRRPNNNTTATNATA